MSEIHRNIRHHDDLLTLPQSETPADQPLAWEEIENGRYMPRRIRGSYRGRALG
jgi:hypothetical protein